MPHQIKLFVSYCHADTKPRPGQMASRVGRIIDEVKYELARDSARSPFKILRDEEITTASDNFRQVIETAMVESDMALAFVSPNYCESPECAAEFARLIELSKPLFVVDTEPAWFNSESNRIAKYRDRIKDILFVPFWEEDGSHGAVLFGYPLPAPDCKSANKYYDALRRLLDGVKLHARDIMARLSSTDDGTAHSTVFLACPTPDVKPDAIRLANALDSETSSVVLFDPQLDVGENETFNEAMSRRLAKSDVYVQLFGSLPGRAVSRSEQRLVRAQYEIAQQSGKPMYLWRFSGFEVEECQPDYAAFLRQIGMTFHLGNYLEFETYLKKKLADIHAQRQSEDRRTQRSKDAGAQAAWPFVTIDAAAPDRDLAQKIAAALQSYVNVDHLGYDLAAEDLAGAVADSNAMVLAYGQSSEGQKRAQAHFRLIRRQKAEFKFKKLELAVGDGAPPTAPPCPSGPDVHIITVADKVDAAAMLRFLQRLGVSGFPAAGTP